MNNKLHAALAVFLLIAALALSSPAHSAQVEAAYMTATRYDDAGRVTGTIAPDPDGGGLLRLKATRNTYTGALLTRLESGQLTDFPNEEVPVASWGGYGFSVFLTKEFTYDAYGRKATESIKGTDGFTVESLVQYSYDSQNRVHCKALRMNKLAFGSLPASACTLGIAGPQGPDRISRFTYDTLDQVLTEERAVGTPLQQTYVRNEYFPATRMLQYQTDANGNKTELQYDTYDRLKKRLYPDPSSTGAVSGSDYNEYDYDENGNVKWERKRNGATIATSFDANNRPRFKNLSDNTYSQDIVYDYDLRGLTLTTRFATEAGASTGVGITNAFNGFGRLQSTTSNVGGVSRTLSYQYDANGNRTRVMHPDGHYFQYRFDGLNRVDGVFENASSTAMLNVGYRPNGQRENITRANGATTTYMPDNAQRLQSFQQDFGGAATADDLTNSFVYNVAGQVTLLTQSNPLYNYARTADQANRTGAYTPNGLNQYTRINGQPIGYDGNGNLVSDGAVAYTYDMENRLVRTTGGPASSLQYDPLGRLAEVTVIPGNTTQFLYDGDALVAEYIVSGSDVTHTHRYVHGDQVDEPWVQYNGTAVGAAARRYLHADHQGSLIAHSINTGTVFAKLAYDPYGIPAPTNIDRFGYTGQTWLKELGLNYYKARMYSPKLGRFLQTDPIFYKDDMNMYAYVGNDPMNKTDPKGLAEFVLANPDMAGDPLFALGTSWDTPDYDIATHGDPTLGSVSDTSRSSVLHVGVRTSAAGLLRQATGVKSSIVSAGLRGHGYKLGTPIRLGACGISVRYAAQLARAAKATVNFTSQTARYERGSDGKVTVTPVNAEGKAVGWESVSAAGDTINHTDSGGNSVQYDYDATTENVVAVPESATRKNCEGASKCN